MPLEGNKKNKGCFEGRGAGGEPLPDVIVRTFVSDLSFRAVTDVMNP